MSAVAKAKRCSLSRDLLFSGGGSSPRTRSSPGPPAHHPAPCSGSPGRPHTAAAVRSQASRSCGLLAAREACKLASLHRVFERTAPLHQKLFIGASATISEGEELLGAPMPSRGKVSGVSTSDGGWDGLASA
eukprot:833211-Prymnesium_polylepis.1